MKISLKFRLLGLLFLLRPKHAKKLQDLIAVNISSFYVIVHLQSLTIPSKFFEIKK